MISLIRDVFTLFKRSISLMRISIQIRKWKRLKAKALYNEAKTYNLIDKYEKKYLFGESNGKST